MKISISTSLAHIDTKGKVYFGDYKDTEKSTYGKATTIGFKPRTLDIDLIKKPYQALCCAIFHPKKETSKKNTEWNSFRRTSANIKLIGGLMSFDFDDGLMAEDELKSIISPYNHYLVHSQSSTKDSPRYKLIVYTGLQFDQSNLDKYRSAYEAVALYLKLSNTIDEKTTDPARLIAPFSRDETPIVISYREDSTLTIPINIEDLPSKGEKEYLITPNSSLPVAVGEELPSVQESDGDYSTSIRYSILANTRADQTPKRYSLAQVAHLAQTGQLYQTECLCPALHPKQANNMGYGILHVKENHTYTMACQGNNPEGGITHRSFRLKSTKPVSEIDPEKYTQVSEFMVISKVTGLFHDLVDTSIEAKELIAYSKGYLLLQNYRKIAKKLQYFHKSNRPYFRMTADMNNQDPMNDGNVLPNIEVALDIELLKPPPKDEEGKSKGYPFDVGIFYTALVHSLKKDCQRIDEVILRVCNKYTEEDVVENNTKLIQYRKYKQLIEPTKPLHAEQAYSHFIQKHLALPAMIRSIVADSFLEEGEKGGLRFHLVFGTGGTGKGIIASAMSLVGMATPVSNGTIALFGKTEDVKIPESPLDLGAHMVCIASDTKHPGKILSDAKMMTDTIIARQNYENGIKVTINSLIIMAADNLNLSNFFSGVDAGQVLRRFRVPKIVNMGQSLLAGSPPSHVTDWEEGSEALREYVKGVTWGIWNEAHTEYKARTKQIGTDLPYPENIDREQANLAKKDVLPSLVVDMLIDLMKHTSKIGGVVNPYDLKIVFDGDTLNRSFCVSTTGDLCMKSKGWKEYGNSLKRDEHDMSGFGYITQAEYLKEFANPVDTARGQTTKSFNVGGGGVNTMSINQYLPLNVEYYMDAKETKQDEEGIHTSDTLSPYIEGAAFTLYKERDMDSLHDKLIDMMANQALPFDMKAKAVAILLGLYVNLMGQEEEVTTNSIPTETEIKELGDLI